MASRIIEDMEEILEIHQWATVYRGENTKNYE